MRGKNLDEEERVQSKIRYDSHMALWITCLNRYRYTTTNSISNFKFFLCILLILPDNTAGLVRMFINLKQWNAMSNAAARLIMILNFCEEIEFDLVQVEKSSKSWGVNLSLNVKANYLQQVLLIDIPNQKELIWFLLITYWASMILSWCQNLPRKFSQTVETIQNNSGDYTGITRATCLAI